jgi:hypothetical protein
LHGIEIGFGEVAPATCYQQVASARKAKTSAQIAEGTFGGSQPIWGCRRVAVDNARFLRPVDFGQFLKVGFPPVFKSTSYFLKNQLPRLGLFLHVEMSSRAAKEFDSK